MKRAELGRRIKNYLFLNNGIALPGIGGFRISHIDQFLSNNESIIHPPFSKLRFYTENINSGIGTFKKYVYDKEVESMMEKHFQSAINDVLNFGEAELDGIGFLKKNENGEFYLITNDLLDYENHYLPVIDVSNIADIDRHVEADGLYKGVGRDKPNDSSILSESIVEPENQAVGKKKQERSFLQPILAISGVILALFMLFLLRTCWSDFKSGNGIEKDIIMSVPTDDATYFPEIKTEEESVTRSFKETEISDSNKNLVDESSEDHSSCLIVLGSFTNISNAESLEMRMIKEGYNTVINKSDSFYRVAIDTKCDQDHIEQELAFIRSKYEPKAWVM